jgi:hypothetical protein
VDDKWSTNAEGRIAVSKKKTGMPIIGKRNINQSKRKETMPPIIPIFTEIKKALLYFSSVLNTHYRPPQPSRFSLKGDMLLIRKLGRIPDISISLSCTLSS